ncbi:MAG: DUF1329 domain-containing protein [Candidatus Dadabacteria bacterium]|nr:MAG: DUF1329 domain-containing protein [Candidatus Dadabacteria bacterium]
MPRLDSHSHRCQRNRSGAFPAAPVAEMEQPLKMPAARRPLLVAVWVASAVRASPASGAAAAPAGIPDIPELKPGAVIDASNVDKVKDYVTPGVAWCVKNGMTLEIVPYREVPLPKAYVEATEKYAGQVSIDDQNMLVNWVAGQPFPEIDPNDPKAAEKIMYNFERNHYFTESLDLHLVDADTGSLYVDAKGRKHYNIERHFVPEWLRVIRFQGRLYHDPKPELKPNHDKVFQKGGLYPLIEPFDLKGVGGISFRYLDQHKQDDTWLYLPMVRRVRRMSTNQRSDALFGQDIDVDSFGGYAGQIPWFEWRLLGERPMLASLHGERLPPEPCEGDGGMTFCEKWEMRPSVWVIEGKSKFPGYAYGKRIIFVDKQTNIITVSDLYDQAGELWKVVMISFRASNRPNPKVDFEYPETRMFAYAYTVVDIQLEHGTRVAMPGLAFQNEPGWYVDLGPDAPTSVGEDWFSIPALIAGGR